MLNADRMFSLAGMQAQFGLPLCQSDEQPGSLSSEWGSVASLWGLEECQIVVKVGVNG